MYPIFRSLLMHIRALQDLQEAQLQLFWAAGINIVEGTAEAFQILAGKAGNQIQMDMDILSLLDGGHYFFSFSQSMARRISRMVCGLVDCTPISSCTSPGRRERRIRSSSSFRISADISK